MENNLGKNIRKLRKALNKTQEEFAQPLGIKHTTVSDYEKGKTKPSKSVFQLIEINYSVDRISLEAEDYDYRVESPKSDYAPHGGWTPQTKKDEWGCIPKVVKIIDSDTIYSKALLQNIDAFYEAVMTKNDRRKGERRRQNTDFNGEDRRTGTDRRKVASRE